MHPNRWMQLEWAGEGLTAEEVAEGWHFCDDWDGLLVGPGMPELEGCTCSTES